MDIKFKRNGEPNWVDKLIYEPVVYSCDISGKPNTLEVGYGWETKSILKIGNMVIHNTHHFNWLQRKMWKLFFGFEIDNVKENT